ncbi:MAG: hypothetical protein J6K74_08055 [Marinifilaceae bacterium]|nr:hypothetical protein [Marinifilaceae bacterium]
MILNSVATWAGRVFHPFMLPIYLLLDILVISPYGRIVPLISKVAIWGTVLTTAILLPSVVIFILKRRGVIKGVSLDNREDRVWPLLSVGVFMSLGYLLLMLFPMTEIFIRLLFTVAIQVLLVSVVSLYWKISMHAVAWGAMCGIFYVLGPLFRDAFICSVVISGIVISSRLLIGAHNGWQVTAGYVQGVLLTIILLLL